MSAPETGGVLQPDAPLLPAGGRVGATNGPDLKSGCSESGQDDSGALRAQGSWGEVETLAALLEPEAFDLTQPAMWSWRRDTQARAFAVASKVILLGYRRVEADDDTVEQVARALAADALQRYAGDPLTVPWDECSEDVREELRASARAAVRAIRKDAQ